MLTHLHYILNDGDSSGDDDEYIRSNKGIIDIGGMSSSNDGEFPMDDP
jgi:hypothetical protein